MTGDPTPSDSESNPQWDEFIAREWLDKMGLPSLDQGLNSKNPSALEIYIKFLELMHHGNTGFEGPENKEETLKWLHGKIEGQEEIVEKALARLLYGTDSNVRSWRDILQGYREEHAPTPAPQPEASMDLGLILSSTGVAVKQDDLYMELTDLLGKGVNMRYNNIQAARGNLNEKTVAKLANSNVALEEVLRSIRLMQMLRDGELFVKTKEAVDGLADAVFTRLNGPEEAAQSIDGGLLYNRHGESLEEAQKIHTQIMDREEHTIKDTENHISYKNPAAVDETIYRYHDAQLDGATTKELTYGKFAAAFNQFMLYFDKPILRRTMGGAIFNALPAGSQSADMANAEGKALAMRIENFENGSSEEKSRFAKEYWYSLGHSDDDLISGEDYIHTLRGLDGYVHRQKLALAQQGYIALPEKAGQAVPDLDGHHQEKYVSAAWLEKKPFELAYLAGLADLVELQASGLYPRNVLYQNSESLAQLQKDYDATPEKRRTTGDALSLFRQYQGYLLTQPETPEQQATIEAVKAKIDHLKTLMQHYPATIESYQAHGVDPQTMAADIDQARIPDHSDRYFFQLHSDKKQDRAYEALDHVLETGEFTPAEEERNALKAQLEDAFESGDSQEWELERCLLQSQKAKVLLKAFTMLQEKQLYASDGENRVNLSRFQDFDQLPADMILCDSEGVPLTTAVIHDTHVSTLGADMDAGMGALEALNKSILARQRRPIEEKRAVTLNGMGATVQEPVQLGMLLHSNVEYLYQQMLENFGLKDTATAKALTYHLGTDIPHLYTGIEGQKKGIQYLQSPKDGGWLKK